MEKRQIEFIKHAAYQIRLWSLKMTTHAGSGHATSSLSAADIVAVLFFHTMRYYPTNYEYPNNDRFILSKGHAAPVLYAAWKEAGVLTEEDLMGYRSFNSVLEGHPTLRFSHTEAATGALGIGLSIGAGEAYSAKMSGLDYRTYVLMGDSEVSEGCVWEAVQIAAYYKLNNLIGIVDCNRLGQSTQTMEGYNTDEYRAIFEAFNWHTIVVDGHDVQQLIKAFDDAHMVKDKPVMIIAKTVKGYGTFAENKQGFHGKAFSKDELDGILVELKKRFEAEASFGHEKNWHPEKPTMVDEKKYTSDLPMPLPTYTAEKPIATRYAYGQALTQLGTVNKKIISLDAEVKNSTYAELFEKKHPERFVQCFVAEQNMVSMGVGFNRRGKVPFISTFAAFLSRAYDQIRMASIGSASLRLVGSHAGVSIGQDGPSQMGLEDISMMRSIHNSVVLYPCDAVSTYKLVGLMAEHNEGISYLRTTRMETPIQYANDESFTIGGCKVLRKDTQGRDRLCIIGAGITLVNALKAYEKLQQRKDPIYVSIIDLYSIKPFDLKTVVSVACNSANSILTVEDHYAQGGIGEMIAAALCDTTIKVYSLSVDKMPRSGTPEELMAYEGINAESIVKKVEELCK